MSVYKSTIFCFLSFSNFSLSSYFFSPISPYKSLEVGLNIYEPYIELANSISILDFSS